MCRFCWAKLPSIPHQNACVGSRIGSRALIYPLCRSGIPSVVPGACTARFNVLLPTQSCRSRQAGNGQKQSLKRIYDSWNEPLAPTAGNPFQLLLSPPCLAPPLGANVQSAQHAARQICANSAIHGCMLAPATGGYAKNWAI